MNRDRLWTSSCSPLVVTYGQLAGMRQVSFFLGLVASFLSDGATRSLFRMFLCVHIQRRASMAEGRGWEVQVQKGVAHTHNGVTKQGNFCRHGRKFHFSLCADCSALAPRMVLQPKTVKKN